MMILWIGRTMVLTASMTKNKQNYNDMEYTYEENR